MFPCGGCGNCNMCCNPCGNQCYDPCYNPCCDPCAFPSVNPYQPCGPCAGPVTTLVKPFCDTQEVALWPVREFSAAPAQVPVFASLLCGPRCTPNPDWTTIMSTSLCCDSGILQIIPIDNPPTAGGTGLPSAGEYVHGISVYLNPAATPGACGAYVKVTVTGQTSASATAGTGVATTRTYTGQANLACCPQKADILFTDAAKSVFYNIRNSDSAGLTTANATMTISIRWC